MTKNFSALSVIIFFSGTFLIMNLLTPIFGDDYAYAFIWDGAQNGNFQNNIGKLYRVESFLDILESQYEHYMTWGGRTVAHIFVQFFVWQGKFLFDVANALIYAALALIIYFLGTGKLEFKNLNAKILLWIFFTMWFCLPEFFQTSLWLTGSCNYLWMSVFQFAFLIPFTLKYRSQKFLEQSPKLKIILMAVSGLIVGWSNEAGGAMIIFVTFLFLIYFWQQKKFESWMATGFIFLLAGYALLMLAPGNFQRYVVDANEATVPFLSLQMFTDNFWDGMFDMIWYEVIFILPLAGYFLRGKKSLENTRFILAFTLGGILTLIMLMFSPEFPARAAFASPIFLIVASVVAIENISFNLPQKLIYAAGIFWIVTITYSIAVDFSVHSQIQDRAEYISLHKNEELIIVDPIDLPKITEKIFWAWTLNQYTRFYGDLTPYTDKFNNRNITYAQYYGLKNIIINEEKWAKQTQLILY